MKLRFTASSISSIAISSTMMLRRLRKMPTTLMAKRTAPSIRKCESVSGAKVMPVTMSLLLRWHGNEAHAVSPFYPALRRRILRVAVLAPPQRQRDRGDDRDKQDDGGNLERIHVLRVQDAPEFFGVAVIGRQ